ncbi:hypothetical protein FRX31_015406 [Thalictrum thalictroides]|uniref:Uncharacterized protein n=1 Tax=Thalictrum thalictroides TaxID=46969 RepID=A0A7J6WC45_THATH|nr:hypothetical protein FRX31_015406 [Thalictrum thalictroides]
MFIPLNELRQNGAQWNGSWLITLWHGDNLNSSHVIRAVKSKWKIHENIDLIRVSHNKFACKLYSKKDGGWPTMEGSELSLIDGKILC